MVIPALTMFANATASWSAISPPRAHWASPTAISSIGARYFFRPLDLWYSLIKSYCFAAAITAIPCYLGFNTQQGAEGVGRATTTAWYQRRWRILMLDALITKLLLVAK